MEPVFVTLKERGFVEQSTEEELIKNLLRNRTTCYVGFDATGKSLHVGHLLPIMALMHIQRAGHRPIALLGGGTTLIGDPSGKTEARPIISIDEIKENSRGISTQLGRFLDFSDDKGLILNNAEWLINLNYIEFLRDIGRHFSVNRMLTAESYKQRLESGLSFLEFNYMLLQAYDYWHLFKKTGCRLQMGGNDQWGNILAGADLIRRLESETVHAITMPLITTSSGIKMGKTHKGAVWLDPNLTSPYDYYQFWINQDDRDVGRFLALFTFLPMDEICKLSSLDGADLREAKEVLAMEATAVCHGKEAAALAREASKKLFGGVDAEGDDSTPAYEIPMEELKAGIQAYILFERCGLRPTKSEARRLISQSGGYANGEQIKTFDQIIDVSSFKDGILLLRAGKKKFMKIVAK